MYHGQRIVVVMPAYNAARTVERTYREIPRDLVDDVVLTDDASGDDTVAVSRGLGRRRKQRPGVAAYRDRAGDVLDRRSRYAPNAHAER